MKRACVLLALAACGFDGVASAPPDGGAGTGAPGGPGMSSDGGGADAFAPDDTAVVVEAGAPLPPAKGTLERVLTITSPTTTALASFPLLVVLDASRITYARCLSGGADLRFADANGLLIEHEIEAWDAAGKSYVWVRVPALAGQPATTTITMHYGYASPPAVAPAKNVWDANFVGVWHLANDQDSTAKHPASANHGGVPAAGVVGPALKFSGTQYMDTATTENLTPLTLEAWSFAAGAPISGTAWSGPLMREGYNLQWNCNGGSFCRTASGGFNPNDNWVGASFGSVAPGVWTHLAATFDGTTIRAYVGGVQTASTPSPAGGTPEGSGQSAKIAADVQLRGYFAGTIDEVRISNVARSAAWIATELASMKDTLVVYGAEQPAP